MLALIGDEYEIQTKSQWSVLVHASSLILNNQDWISIFMSFEPHFHACIRVQGLSNEELLSRCFTKLRPLINADVSDFHDANGNSNVEHVFNESEFFDCLGHLAVLASHNLDSLPPSAFVSTSSSRILIGRDSESRLLDGCLHPVIALDDSSSYCKFVLIHGIPGTGKSLLADEALIRLDTAYKECGSFDSDGKSIEHYLFKVQAHSRDSVRDGLHKMGLILCKKLGIDSTALVEDVLGSNVKKARLRQFLQTQRFVVLADDAGKDGFHELLHHLPRSSKPCAVILTSQFGEFLISEINRSYRKEDFIAIELQCFTPDVSLKLVEAICDSSDSAKQRLGLFGSLGKFWNFWLTQVFEQLGQLPMGVRLFAEWISGELAQSMPEGVDFDLASLQARWIEKEKRIQRATVCHVLDKMRLLQAPGEYEECVQLLGLLALCPSVKVPWSLFDGVSHISAMHQSCKVRRQDGSGGVMYSDAVILSDSVDGDNVFVQTKDRNEDVVARSSVVFDAHFIGMVVRGEQYKVQMRTPQANIRGTRVEVDGLVKTAPNNTLIGRVLQFHADDGTVSVVFGCETGA